MITKMTGHKFCTSLVNLVQKRNTPLVKNFVRLGIGSISLALLPYEIKENTVVANVNGVFRFLRCVY